MDLLWFAISNDWAVLLPIVFCSVLCLGVFMERIFYFRKNKLLTAEFVHQLERDLEYGHDAARASAGRHPGIIGEVTLEGLTILDKHPHRFETMFDVTVSLASRDLDRGLAILGTIATVSPYLGLFGTVIRILLTFGEMAQKQTTENASAVMFGIGSALIATAFGLGVAIISVALNNYFRTHVERFAGDFEDLKLVLLSAIGGPAAKRQPPMPQRPARSEI